MEHKLIPPTSLDMQALISMASVRLVVNHMAERALRRRGRRRGGRRRAGLRRRRGRGGRRQRRRVEANPRA